MQKTQLVSVNSGTISIGDLERQGQGWLLDAEVRQFSRNTIALRRLLLEKLLWFLRQDNLDVCGKMELRRFLAYFNGAHEQKDGRWGIKRFSKPVRPRTVQIYYANLKTLFRFLVSEGIIEESPVEGLQPPISRPDQI
jgi:site-specific recombinase XerD